MQNRFQQRLLGTLVACWIALLPWHCPAALAFDNPELLPDIQTPIIDLANFLPELQEENLIKEIESFEQDTGWKLRVLTQYDRTPGRAVKGYWGLDDHSVLLVADGRGGNLLAFSVGDDLYQFLPRTFWVELQTRFGNLYFVRENGENNSIARSLETVRDCLFQGVSRCTGTPARTVDSYSDHFHCGRCYSRNSCCSPKGRSNCCLAVGFNYVPSVGNFIYRFWYRTCYHSYFRHTTSLPQYHRLCPWCFSSISIPLVQPVINII